MEELADILEAINVIIAYRGVRQGYSRSTAAEEGGETL